MWKEKLNKEAEFEFEEQHSRYDFDYGNKKAFNTIFLLHHIYD